MGASCNFNQRQIFEPFLLKEISFIIYVFIIYVLVISTGSRGRSFGCNNIF